MAEMEEKLKIKGSCRKPKDLGKSRLQFDSDFCKRAYDVISNWGSPFETRITLVNLSTDAETLVPIMNDLLEAEIIRESHLKEFLQKRIQSSKKKFSFMTPSRDVL